MHSYAKYRSTAPAIRIALFERSLCRRFESFCTSARTISSSLVISSSPFFFPGQQGCSGHYAALEGLQRRLTQDIKMATPFKSCDELVYRCCLLWLACWRHPPVSSGERAPKEWKDRQLLLILAEPYKNSSTMCIYPKYIETSISISAIYALLQFTMSTNSGFRARLVS